MGRFTWHLDLQRTLDLGISFVLISVSNIQLRIQRNDKSEKGKIEQVVIRRYSSSEFLCSDYSIRHTGDSVIACKQTPKTLAILTFMGLKKSGGIKGYVHN